MSWGPNPLHGKARRRMVRDLRERDGDDCQLCGWPIDFDLPRDHQDCVSLDHVLERRYGGTNSPDNLRLAHAVCNSRRSNPAYYGRSVA